MKKRHAVCGAVLLLAYVVASPAQTDPGLSTKPAGVTLSGERLAPEKAPVDLSRPEMRQIERLSTRLESEYADAATRGEAWAQTKLGKFYVANSEDVQLQQQGLELLRQAAEQDDAEAIYILATATAAGAGVEQSNVEAFIQMKRAAELGNADAQFELASMYGEGRVTPLDTNLALLWGRKSAKQGNVRAQFAVGRVLIESGQEQQAEAILHLRLAANAKDPTAAMFLATVFALGEFGVNKDEREAEALLMPLADSGDAECQFALASLYRFGESFTERRGESQIWLKHAADQGHKKAAEILSAENE